MAGFGWNTVACDGHDIDQIIKGFKRKLEINLLLLLLKLLKEKV